MTKLHDSKTVIPTPVVEDPHPGSVSDGTHPAAMEHKQPKPSNGGVTPDRVPSSAAKSDPRQGQTTVNSEAPRHPNKAAYGS